MWPGAAPWRVAGPGVREQAERMPPGGTLLSDKCHTLTQ